MKDYETDSYVSENNDASNVENTYTSSDYAYVVEDEDSEYAEYQEEEEFQDDEQLSADEEERMRRKKKRKVTNTIIYIIAGILIFAGLFILFKEFVLIPKDETDGLVSEEDYLNNVFAATETYTPLATPISHYDIIPVKFHFIDVKVNGVRQSVSCDIYPVGIEGNAMGTIDSAEDCAWLSELPYVVPGDVGNSVIGGHNLWRGTAGTFSLIKNLQIGDTVAVTFDKGFTRYFEVTKCGECQYNESYIMETDVDEPILTIYTCKGNWDHSLQQSKTRVYAICKPISR